MRSEWQDFEDRQRQSEGRGLRVIALFAVLAAGFLLGMHYARKPDAYSVQPASASTGDVFEDSSEPTDAVTPPRPVVRQTAPAPRSQSYVGVYECLESGQRVVSDRPCSGSASVRTLVVDQPDPIEAANQLRRTQAAGQAKTQATSRRRVDGDTYCIYVRTSVTGTSVAHTCRWFESLQSCQIAADRINGHCGRPRQ